APSVTGPDGTLAAFGLSAALALKLSHLHHRPSSYAKHVPLPDAGLLAWRFLACPHLHLASWSSVSSCRLLVLCVAVMGLFIPQARAWCQAQKAALWERRLVVREHGNC